MISKMANTSSSERWLDDGEDNTKVSMAAENTHAFKWGLKLLGLLLVGGESPA